MSRAIIIGGGIGGLATAIAMRLAGVEAVVFEQHSPGKTQVGGGIHMWTNAMRALERIGLAERVAEQGAPIERTEYRTWRGRLLAAWPVGEIGREFGLQDTGISRAELLQVLVEAQDEGSVRADTRCTGFEQDDAGVTAHFADGSEQRGTVLIGADGLRSTIREQLFGASPMRYAGYTQVQSLVGGAAELLPGGLERVVFGRGNRAVLHQVGEGRLFWAAAMYGPEGGFADGRDKKPRLLERFRGWEHPIEAAIEATSEEELISFDIYDREPVTRWGEGRVTLLGDAAHPMTTNLSQGGCQALEDSVVLAGCLARERDVGRALRDYEARRIPRTSALVKRSHQIARIGRLENPLACTVRDRVLGVTLRSVALREHRKLAAHPL